MADDVVNDVIDVTDERKALDSLDDKETETTESDTGESEKTDETDDVVEEDEDKTEDNTEETDESEADPDVDSLYKQLKTVDKEIFKKIPELKEIVFREKAFTEIYPTVAEAEQAKETAGLFQQFNADIMSGDSTTLLEALQSVDKNGLNEFVGNFIPSVEKLSKDLYFDMVAPELKKCFRIFARNPNEAVQQSAKNLHYMVFGDNDLDKDYGLARSKAKPSENEEKLTKREREFEERQLNTFAVDVKNTCKGRAERFISSAFADSGLSKFMTETLTEKILQRVGNELEADTRHMGNINALWQKARAEGFTSESKDRIVSAYLSRAKALVPKHRQKVLAEAKIAAKTKEGFNFDKKRVIPSNQNNSGQLSAGQKIDPKKVDWDKTDERTMLDGKITFRK